MSKPYSASSSFASAKSSVSNPLKVVKGTTDKDNLVNTTGERLWTEFKLQYLTWGDFAIGRGEPSQPWIDSKGPRWEGILPRTDLGRIPYTPIHYTGDYEMNNRHTLTPNYFFNLHLTSSIFFVGIVASVLVPFRTASCGESHFGH